MPIGNPAARKLRIRAHVSRPGPDCVPRIAVPSEQQLQMHGFLQLKQVRHRALARRLVLETCGGRQKAKDL
jgi:hypothetical protein